MRRNSAGFTFIDVMIAVVIVGVAVAAVVQSMASGTQANGQATQLSVALNLARNVHEYAVSQPMSKLGDMDKKDYCPVIDSAGNPLNDLPGWTQSVRIYKVDAGSLQSSVDLSTPTTTGYQLRRVVVKVQFRGPNGSGTVHTASWLIAKTGL